MTISVAKVFDPMTPMQCRMARAALKIGVRDLAKAAKVSPATIVRFEAGGVMVERTIDTIRAALERLGIEFIGDHTVRRHGP